MRKNKNLFDRHNCALEHLSEWGLPWPRWHWCHSRWQCLELFSFSKTTGQIVRCSGEKRKTWKITIIDMDQFYSWYFVLNIYNFPFCRVVPVLCVVVFMFSFGKQKHIRKRETPTPHVIQQLIGQAPLIKFYLTYIADRLDGLLLFLLLPLGKLSKTF